MVCLLGSSPHARGAHNIVGHLIHTTGIIPACAGSTFDMIEILRQIGDHPRMCGEHVRRQSVRQLLTGIIPACAGSTTCVQIGVNRKWDHPRMCGEHAWAFSLTSSKSGSSPHVRGARGFMLSEAVHCGIIPACAGSTPQMTHSISITWDHPRMCGEHIVKHVRPCSKRGSSPHVRGARIPSQRQGRLSGIIPACAGSTTLP